MNIHSQADVAKRQPYSGFDRLPIGGEWRQGKMHALKDIDPYTDEVLLEIPQADRSDLDDAYAAAARAQPAWAQEPAGTRGEVLHRAAHVMETRRDEIVSWIIRESGSTRLKANLEWASSHAIMVWAASAASQVNGRLLPTDIRGKASSVLRKPVGVGGVISPWNWPLHLSARSVAPALAVGDAVVIKPASDTPVTGGLLLAKIFGGGRPALRPPQRPDLGCVIAQEHGRLPSGVAASDKDDFFAPAQPRLDGRRPIPHTSSFKLAQIRDVGPPGRGAIHAAARWIGPHSGACGQKPGPSVVENPVNVREIVRLPKKRTATTYEKADFCRDAR